MMTSDLNLKTVEDESHYQRFRLLRTINTDVTVLAEEEENESVPSSEMASQLNIANDLRSQSDNFSAASMRNSKNNAEKEKNIKQTSRSYRYVELEKALVKASLLESYNDRLKFHQEYLRSIRENSFETFLRASYQKLDEHEKNLEHQRQEERAKKFTFVDLEKRFLEQDPCRDIKIVFVDDPSGIKKIRSATLRYEQARTKKMTEQVDIESFYSNGSQRLMCDSPRARDEITLFARRAGERLHEHLPHLPRVPHRVTIVDQRDQLQPMTERAILQMNHQKVLKSIEERRQITKKMIEQSHKNQIKVKRHIPKTLSTMINRNTYSRELLERIHQIEQSIIACRSFNGQSDLNISSNENLSTRRIFVSSSSRSMSESNGPTTLITPTYSSSSTPFTDILPFYPIDQEKSSKVDFQSSRPFSSPQRPKRSMHSYRANSQHSY